MVAVNVNDFRLFVWVVMTYISFTFPEQEEAIFIHTQEATELQRSSFLKIKQQYAEDHGEKSETGSESEELIGERIQ